MAQESKARCNVKTRYAATYKEMGEMFPAALQERNFVETLARDGSKWLLTLDPETLLTRQVRLSKQGENEEKAVPPNIVALLAQLVCSDSAHADQGWLHPVIVKATSDYLAAHRPSWKDLQKNLL